MAGCCTGVFFGVGNSVRDPEQKFLDNHPNMGVEQYMLSIVEK